MLPKSLRLTRQNFLKAKSSGFSQKFPHFLVISSKRSKPVGEHNRFSILVSTKLSKHAVVRNNLKRRIYKNLPKSIGLYDFIILPKFSMLKLTDEEICSQINQFLSKNSVS